MRILANQKDEEEYTSFLQNHTKDVIFNNQ